MLFLRTGIAHFLANLLALGFEFTRPPALSTGRGAALADFEWQVAVALRLRRDDGDRLLVNHVDIAAREDALQQRSFVAATPPCEK